MRMSGAMLAALAPALAVVPLGHAEAQVQVQAEARPLEATHAWYVVGRDSVELGPRHYSIDRNDTIANATFGPGYDTVSVSPGLVLRLVLSQPVDSVAFGESRLAGVQIEPPYVWEPEITPGEVRTVYARVWRDRSRMSWLGAIVGR